MSPSFFLIGVLILIIAIWTTLSQIAGYISPADKKFIDPLSITVFWIMGSFLTGAGIFLRRKEKETVAIET